MTQKLANSKNKTRGVFVYALHKSASMFLVRFFRDVSERSGFAYYSRNNGNEKDLLEDISTSFCYGPTRTFELDRRNFKHIEQQFHLFQVRDPRDVLVSQYFSFGWIHSDRAWSKAHIRERDYIQSVDIDRYVLSRAKKTDKAKRLALKKRYEPILKHANHDEVNIAFLKYEDMVTDFRAWLPAAIKAFAFPDEGKIIDELFESYYRDFIPPKEDQQQHKRKITPGDHVDKLKPETIGELNSIFNEELELFGYL